MLDRRHIEKAPMAPHDPEGRREAEARPAKPRRKIGIEDPREMLRRNAGAMRWLGLALRVPDLKEAARRFEARTPMPEETLTIVAAGCFRSSGAAALQTMKPPVRLISSTRRQSSMVVSRNEAENPMPAA